MTNFTVPSNNFLLNNNIDLYRLVIPIFFFPTLYLFFKKILDISLTCRVMCGLSLVLLDSDHTNIAQILASDLHTLREKWSAVIVPQQTHHSRPSSSLIVR